jgi:hypothetical protein
MAILLINPPEDEAQVEKNVEMVLIIRWSSDTLHDVDLWFTDGKEVVGFPMKQASNFYLERDDIGPDTVDNILGYSVNEESVSIIAPVPGTYTAGAHLYSVRGNVEYPIRVTWMLRGIRPRSQIIASGSAQFMNRGEEKTLLRFDINEDGKVRNIDKINEYPFILRSRRGMYP